MGSPEAETRMPICENPDGPDAHEVYTGDHWGMGHDPTTKRPFIYIDMAGSDGGIVRVVAPFRIEDMSHGLETMRLIMSVQT